MRGPGQVTSGRPPGEAVSRLPGSEGEAPRHHPPEDAFRPDLEGLRGLAILLVLLFHAGIPGIPGGFIGVDVFFVLSGFLITGLLIRERERTGRVSLPAFYARRARRILPAALVVTIGTMLAAALVLPPLDILRAAEDAVAVALSVGNIRFAATATDYFAGTSTPSPFLHYWSLGVEEQFYLLWPALLILATRFGRPRLGAGVVLAVVVATSLALAIWLTGVAAPWAFYSLPTRAWQLGLGGLLAIAAVGPVGRRVAVARAAAGWAGLAAVLAGSVLIDASTPYPGVAALLPAVGTAAVIASGSGLRWSPGRLLAIAPMRFLGRISYSLYLVHWPILILPAAGLALDQELPLEVRLGLALASVAVGAVCWRIVEEPIHHAVRFRAQPWRALGIASAAIATTLVVVFAVSTETSQALDTALTAAPIESPGPSDGGPPAQPSLGAGPTQVAIASPDQTSSPTPTVTAAAATPGPTPEPTASPVAPATAGPASSPAGSPAARATDSSAPTPPARPTAPPTAAPQPTRTQAPPSAVTPSPRGSAPNPNSAQPLPANVRPPLRSAASDRERIEADGCELGNFDVQPRTCVYGNPNGAITVALVGDSHAAQWFPALEVLAQRHGWRLVVFTKISCRFTDLPIYSRDLKREYTECEQWRELVVGQLQALKPDVVVVSAARGMATINPADDSPVRQGEGMARLLARIPGRHAIIVDTPQSHVEVPACLSSHISDTRPCDTPRDVAVSWRYLLLERTAARIDGATLINMTDVLCPGDVCPAVLGGYIVLRDVFHLTATFSASLADELEPPLVRLTGG